MPTKVPPPASAPPVANKPSNPSSRSKASSPLGKPKAPSSKLSPPKHGPPAVAPKTTLSSKAKPKQQAIPLKEVNLFDDDSKQANLSGSDSDNDREEYSETSEFTPTFWDGNIPVPDGVISALAAKLHRDKQFQACEEIATYLKDGTIDIATSLNSFEQVLMFLLPVPNTHFLR